MKYLSALLLFLGPQLFRAQIYPSLNVSLVSRISPNTDTTKTPVGNKYSGCWGWYQASKNKEYAISGASNGTYFIDISAPASPSVSAFVPGKKGCTWRELKTYKNYCYVASDDNKPNTFQIIDMKYLPDSVHLLHNNNIYFERGHTLWVDSNKLYVGGVTFSSGSSPMVIFSLATPSAPALMKRLETNISPNIIDYVHDMYARNDTIYASAGYKGLFVLKHNLTTNSLSILGSYTNYQAGGYNHSSFLTKNGKYLLFCDEVPNSLPVHMVDVQNLGNIQPLSTFFPAPRATPHNPYMLGNNLAIVSCYQDGLYIYDISQPQNIKQLGFFDTFPQGGVTTGAYVGSDYNGNWGAYPFLPSGLIVANDMQNGVFILNPAAAYTTTVKTDVDLVGLSETSQELQLSVFPNPAHETLTVSIRSAGRAIVRLTDCYGKTVYENTGSGSNDLTISTSQLADGLYVLSVKGEKQSLTKKIQIIH